MEPHSVTHRHTHYHTHTELSRQLGVNYQAQGHIFMWQEEAGIGPVNFGLINFWYLIGSLCNFLDVSYSSCSHEVWRFEVKSSDIQMTVFKNRYVGSNNSVALLKAGMKSLWVINVCWRLVANWLFWSEMQVEESNKAGDGWFPELYANHPSLILSPHCHCVLLSHSQLKKNTTLGSCTFLPCSVNLIIISLLVLFYIYSYFDFKEFNMTH